MANPKRKLTDKEKDVILYHSNCRGVGDCATAMSSRVGHEILETRTEAQEIADLVCDDQGWANWGIVFTGLLTHRRRGTADKKHKIIVLHLIGQTVGTLLHELAHEVGCSHDAVFKAKQTELIKLWLG